MGSFNDIVPILIVGLILWLSGLTVVFYRLLSHYKRIAPKAGKGDLIKALECVLAAEESNKKQLSETLKEMQRIDKNAARPLQKLGVVRFNPFSETGGEQSFSICLLDRDENGFIMTGLHTRETTRVYMKPVSAGESKFDLSKEETKALKQATKK